MHRRKLTSSAWVTKKRANVLAAVLLAMCFSGSVNADLNNAVRYREMQDALQQDGWNGSDTAYYKSLAARVQSDPGNQRLKKLKYYCEVLPACTTRDLYVIMIWGAGGTFNYTDLTNSNSYNQYSAVHQRLHDGNVKGAYLVGFWDNYFARRDDGDKSKHAPEEPWPAWHVIHGNPWTPGLNQLQTFIDSIPRTSKLIVAGASLGGGTAAALAGMLAAADRPIDHLLLFDPAGIYGKRVEAIAHVVPPNVRRFFNIWQEKGCWPADYGVSGRFTIANPQYTTATQVLYTGGSDGGPCIDSVSKSVHSDTWMHKPRGGDRQRIAVELLKAIDHAIAPPPQIKQSRKIEGSHVTIQSAPSSPGQTRFEFSTNMAWWTGIRIHRANGEPYWIEREHGTGPYNVVLGGGKKRRGQAALSIRVAELAPQVKIEFWTAKLFGVHTYIAETVINRAESQGRVVKVNWPAP